MVTSEGVKLQNEITEVEHGMVQGVSDGFFEAQTPFEQEESKVL